MKVYVVIQEGIYRHNIFGIFSNPKIAIECATAVAENDIDNYHTYDVRPFKVDKYINIKQRGWIKKIRGSELEPIYSISKNINP